jgi:hypothetical protein
MGSTEPLARIRSPRLVNVDISGQGEYVRPSVLKCLLILAATLVCGSALAHLPIALIDESSLPYNLSPSNYDNSPSNYDNSPSNHDNSESNYDNSALNCDNGRNGDRRLIYKDRSSLNFAGYYVAAKN